ncbi:MAG: hypothetical protein AAF710_04500 [Planctomycetota bacterium]
MRRDEPDYIVEIDGVEPIHTERLPTGGKKFPGAGGRPWIAVTWTCCSTYSRVYRNRRGDAYEGNCPKCGTAVRAVVGPGGTESRFFEAG